MKLLMISTDRKIFEEGSAVRARMIGYSQLYEEMHIVIFAKKSLNFRPFTSGNLHVYPTSSTNKFGYIQDAKKIGNTVLNTSESQWTISCQDPFETGLVGIALKKRYVNMSLLLQIHTDLYSPYFAKYSKMNALRRVIASQTLPRADRVRVVSKRIEKSVLEKFPDLKSKIVVEPIAVDQDAIKIMSVARSLKEIYPQFSKIVLMASRLHKEKHIELAIDAWKEVIKKMPNAGLIIVGEGEEEKNLRNLIQRIALTKNIILESWADRNTLISYYKTADVFLNTSLYEGYGMTLVEAHAAGCPIISTDVGIAPEIGATIISHDDSVRVAEIIVSKLTL